MDNWTDRIEQSIIPQANRQYLDSSFWEQRYSQYGLPVGGQSKNEDQLATREWLADYSVFADIFRKNVPKSASILILGCGNSLLGEELFDDGYHKVHNIDISESVINLMSSHCEKCSQLKWSTMDCRELTFANQQFDVVIEKATIEVFFVAETSLWDVSDETMRNVKLMADQIVRVLKSSTGQFFSISFTAPHFRKELFNRMFVDDKTSGERMNVINVHQLGDHFHYYMYHLSNDPTALPVSIFSYEPPKVTHAPDPDISDDSSSDAEQFLYSISSDL